MGAGRGCRRGRRGLWFSRRWTPGLETRASSSSPTSALRGRPDRPARTGTSPSGAGLADQPSRGRRGSRSSLPGLRVKYAAGGRPASARCRWRRRRASPTAAVDPDNARARRGRTWLDHHARACAGGRRGYAQPGFDLPAPQLVGQDPSARAPAVTFALRQRARYAARLPRKWSRITSRSAPAKSPPDRPAARLDEHGVLEPGRERDVAVPGEARQRGDVGREQLRLPEQADVPAGSVAPTSSDGSSCGRRARARHRASGRASTATCRRRSACPGRCRPG